MSSSPRYDLVLVGGGIVGACLAEELATAGASVLVLDAGPTPGHATAQAAGIAVPSLRYRTDPGFYGWLCSARAALDDDIARLSPLAGAFSVARPVVRLLREEDLSAHGELLASGALGTPLEAERAAAELPRLRVPDGHRALRGEAGLMIDGRAYLRAVADAAVRAGAEWRQDVRVTAVEEEPDGVVLRDADGGTVGADRVVVTAGCWSGELTGGRLPVRPQRGQLAVLDGENLDSIVSGRLYLAPLPGGGVVVGATEEDAGFDERCTAAGVARVLAYAVRTVPDLAGAAVSEIRAGLRPVSATGRPLAGRVPGARRVFTACGHAGHGLLSARLTARGTAAGLLRRDWDALPEEFCPADGPVTAGR